MTKEVNKQTFQKILVSAMYLLDLLDKKLFKKYIKKIKTIERKRKALNNMAKKYVGSLNENNAELLELRNEIFSDDSEIDNLKKLIKQNLLMIEDDYRKSFLQKENYQIVNFSNPEQLAILHALKLFLRNLATFDVGRNASDAIKSLEEFLILMEKIQENIKKIEI